MATAPIIDFWEYGSGAEDVSKVSEDTIKTLGKRVIDAFKSHGFCYLKNHGVDENLMEEYMQVSRVFFEKPDELKEKYPMGLDYRFGWVKLEREHLNEKRSAGDLHEAFNYTPLYDTAWPPVEKFEDLSKAVFEAGREFALRFCDVLSLGLNLPKDFMRNAHKRIGQKGSPTAVRTLYYPPLPAGMEVADDQARLGEHFDWGTLAFDFQDNVGGFEVRTPKGEFVPVDPIPGAVVVTPGAFIQHWTADMVRATVHRILIPQDERRYKTRQAIIWFLNADDDFEIKCIDGSDTYKPVSSRDFIQYMGDIALMEK